MQQLQSFILFMSTIMLALEKFKLRGWWVELGNLLEPRRL